jgi:hypothetical protein
VGNIAGESGDQFGVPTVPDLWIWAAVRETSPGEMICREGDWSGQTIPSVLLLARVSFAASSSAPSVATERLRTQLVNRSQIQVPLQTDES